MIFHFHSPLGSVMVGADYVPRIGEKMRFPAMDRHDDHVGLFLIEDVVYGAPSNPGHQRVDVYGRRVADIPANLSYANVMEAS